MSVQSRPPKGVKLKKGERRKFIVRYRDPAGKERSRTFTYDEYSAPEKAAKQFDADQRAKLARGTWIDPEDQKVTVGQLVREWQESAPYEGTREQRKMLVDNLGKLDDMPIATVRASHITTWVATLRNGRPWANGKKLSEGTIDNKFGQLRSVFTHAVDDGLLAANPMKHSTVKRARRQKGLKAVLEAEVPDISDIRALIVAAEDGGRYSWKGEEDSTPPAPWMALCIRLAAETGLRAGEVAGLLGRDVDIENRVLRVRQQCGHKQMVHMELKTNSSERDVPISSALARDLTDVLRGPDDAAIPGATGNGTSGVGISTFFPGVRRLAGVSEKISFHGLRHFYATSLLERGESLHTVAALLGHDEINTTDRVYAHFQPGRLDASRAAISSIAGSLRDEVPNLHAV